MLKSKLKYVLLFALIILSITSFGQHLSLNNQPTYEWLRISQLMGEIDSTISFNLRPQSFTPGISDTVASVKALFSSKKEIVKVSIFPIMLDLKFDGHHPHSFNDGSMIRSKGLQSRISLGAYAKAGPISIQFRPEYVWAANKSYPGFTSLHQDDDIRLRFSRWWKNIDNPERLGNETYKQWHLGQSNILLNFKPISLGLSSENVWWGPGKYNGMILSNNASGFNHYTLQSNKPTNIGIGHIEYQLIGGRLEGSGFSPTQTIFDSLYLVPKDDGRYLSGLTVTYSPKWIPGLSLGLNRVIQQYWQDAKTRKDYLPIFDGLFKTQVNDDTLDRDQLLSIHYRFFNTKHQFEVYGEWGRNDASQHLRDLFLQPAHSRAYMFGFAKQFRLSKGMIYAGFEVSHLQRTVSHILRPEPIWYRHGQVKHGYTHNGEILGAASGAGSNSETLNLKWIRQPQQWYGLTFQRTNVEVDYTLLSGNDNGIRDSYWIDYKVAMEMNKKRGRILWNFNVSFIRSKNYQWNTTATNNISFQSLLIILL